MVEHMVWDHGVAGSNPVFPTIDKRGLSSAGRAPALHAGGHRFDPDRLHQKILTKKTINVILKKSLKKDKDVP